MHIKNPFRSGKVRPAEGGGAWSLQDLVGGSPIAAAHHGKLVSRVMTISAILLIAAGVGLVASDGGFLGANLTGSGSVASNACDYPNVQNGTLTDPCDLVAGLACAPDSQCRCKAGTWNGSRCIVPEATPEVRVRVPDFATCGPRCSTRYAAVSVTYLSQNGDCAVPVQGSETYQRDCACVDGTEAYADFTQRCEDEKHAATPVPGGTTVACSDPMCASGGSCVCCNGSKAADCSLTCPGSTRPVSDCSACGPLCSLSADGFSCTCSDSATCPNGASDPPSCRQCPLGIVGSVCASAPNACGDRDTGEILSSCECSAIPPDDADCPVTGSSFLEGLSGQLGTSLIDASTSATPIRFALEMKKAGYREGHVEFEVDLVFSNVGGSMVALSQVTVDLARPFGGMRTAVSGLLGDGLVADLSFDGRDHARLLGQGRNVIAPGSSARVSMVIAVDTNARQLQWELPVSLSMEIPATGEKLNYDPPPATLGLIRREAAVAVPSATTDASSQGGPLEFGMLRGSVFRDADADGKRDAEEKGVPYVKVVVTDLNGIQQVLTTDSSGKYDTLVVAGQTSVAVSSDNDVLGTSPRFTTVSYSESFVAPGNIVTIDAVGVAY